MPVDLIKVRSLANDMMANGDENDSRMVSAAIAEIESLRVEVSRLNVELAAARDRQPRPIDVITIGPSKESRLVAYRCAVRPCSAVTQREPGGPWLTDYEAIEREAHAMLAAERPAQ